jgi:hypothetical protein
VQVLLLDEPTGDLDTLRVAADPNRIGALVPRRAETEIRPAETETLTETAAVPGAAGIAAAARVV